MTNYRLKPLRTPEIDLRPGCFLSFLNHIPVIGWGIVNNVVTAKLRPYKEQVDQQLKERDVFPEEQWGHDPEKIAFAKSMGAVISRHVEWANNHFLPDDPVSVVLWEVDSFGMFEVFREIEERLGISLNEYPGWDQHIRGKLENLIDFFYNVLLRDLSQGNRDKNQK